MKKVVSIVLSVISLCAIVFSGCSFDEGADSSIVASHGEDGNAELMTATEQFTEQYAGDVTFSVWEDDWSFSKSDGFDMIKTEVNLDGENQSLTCKVKKDGNQYALHSLKIGSTIYFDLDAVSSAPASDPPASSAEPMPPSESSVFSAPESTEPKSQAPVKSEAPPPASKVEQTQSQQQQVVSQDPNESITVYITKSGERYHYENPCGNGTYYPITLAEALRRGYTPCRKCVLH